MPHPAMSPNHVAVITGGASGIGLAAAMRFARLGMKVCIADLGADRLAEARSEDRGGARGGAADVMAVAADVSRVEEVSALESAVQQALRRHRCPDEQCRHPAGQPRCSDRSENWQRMLAVNLWGVIHGTQIFAPGMIERGRPGLDHQHRLEAGHHHAARRSRL